MTRILWHSNAPHARTGYGDQTKVFVPRITRALGLDPADVAISAFYGFEGSMSKWGDHRVYPRMDHPYGADAILPHATHHFGGDPAAGLIVTLIDVWVIPPPVATNVNFASWVPVDHDPPPPGVLNFFRHSDAVPIAMSRFGERLLAEFEPVYVPHGIDTATYKPRAREGARERLRLSNDAFVVGMVAANKGNPSRKSFSEAFQAFAKFVAKRKDAVLLLHAEPQGRADGVNLPRLLEACGVPDTAYCFPDPYSYQVLGYSDDHMADVYSAMDVLLNPAMGEGFGIPIVEAQACGTPVIVTDFSSMSELCGAGWKVDGQKFWTFLESWQVIPNVGELVWALDSAYDNAARLRDEARAFAVQYDADRVTEEFWVPALRELEERFAGREPLAVAA